METHEFTRWGLAALVTVFTIGFGVFVLWVAMVVTKDARKLKEQMSLVETGSIDKLLDRLSMDATEKLLPEAWRYGMYIFIARAVRHDHFHRAWQDQYTHPHLNNDSYLGSLFIDRWNEMSASELDNCVAHRDFIRTLKICGEVHHKNPAISEALDFLIAGSLNFEQFSAVLAIAKRNGQEDHADRALRGAILTAERDDDRERMLREHLTRDPLKYAELWLPFAQKEKSQYRLGIIIAFTPEESPAHELALEKLHAARVPASV